MVMEVDYRRQETLDIVQEQRVAVIGCGGIGSWVGYFLALAGVRELDLFDGDEVADHNLNRLPFDPGDIGKPKSLALAELIKRVRPSGVDVNTYGHFDPQWHQAVLDECNRVIVSTDTLRSRRMIYDAWGKGGQLSGGYIELGADGHGLTVTGSPAEWSSALEEQPGYASVPVHVGPCTLAASIATYYILKNASIRDTFRVDWVDRLVENGARLRINTYEGV